MDDVDIDDDDDDDIDDSPQPFWFRVFLHNQEVQRGYASVV